MTPVRLADLLPDLDPRAAQVAAHGVSADSREIRPGGVFVGVAGTRADGAAFAADAARRGAAAVVVGPDAALPEIDVPVIRVAEPRAFLSQLAARLYPEQPENVVAVTGTSGKTSVAAFVRQIWDAQGFSAASIGTTGVVAPDRAEYGALTTPDPVALHKLLSELAQSGVTHASMEASSHGLDQHRLDGVRLKAGAFTNLGRDHMDYHPTVEHYMRSKMRLFEALLPKGAPAVIYADDIWSDQAVEAARDAGLDVLTVGRRGDFLALKRVEHERHRQRAEILADGVLHEIVLPLAGDFQIANALVAAGLAAGTGVPVDRALKALEKLQGAPGRLDLVGHAPSGAPVYVDYAHKPDALENVLRAVRPFTTGRVVLVFGCGGDRDKGKRPLMGAIAERLADVAVVTDDNPRSEDPATIRAAILEGARGAIEIGDRREAIRRAVAMLRAGDTLVIAGKGHEDGQTVGDKTTPFSDHAEVRAAIEGRAA
ncbi:MAG TPA: UDP-N-acetylmuramoyl-L-alanyl-D-glutamate--2,6-diaminopimelate ligase [Mesorhizobium sp.]|jgi:UDP-N-acetylmuramoyl-L-alanyl-D-glutamate--2,6-diaminopimelate ligase|nr:UDP-N-acetylmuramoyl-L-alanyl-D-glutamate--2,6-diaminopimelate ligase [Mesorhizobium sp.]